jgi:hypothetical protein
MKTSGTEQRTQICIHRTTSFLTKVPKIYDEEMRVSSTNIAWKSGYPSAGK